MTLAERLDQLNLAGQMIRVVRADAMQFIQQFLGNHLGLDVLHAMNHAMSHRPDRRKTILLFQPINQGIRSRFVIGGDDACAPCRFRAVVERQFVPLRPMRSNFP